MPEENSFELPVWAGTANCLNALLVESNLSRKAITESLTLEFFGIKVEDQSYFLKTIIWKYLQSSPLGKSLAFYLYSYNFSLCGHASSHANFVRETSCDFYFVSILHATQPLQGKPFGWAFSQ